MHRKYDFSFVLFMLLPIWLPIWLCHLE